METEVPLDAETWAKTAAKLLGRTPEATPQMLDQMGIDEDDWARSDGYYASRILRDMEANAMELPRLYAAACVEEMARRAAPPPAVEEPPPSPAIEAASEAVAEPPPEAPAAAVPTFLLAKEQAIAPLPVTPVTPTVKPKVRTVAFTMPSTAEPALPFAESLAPAAQAMEAIAPPKEHRNTGTLPLEDVPARAPLPFQPPEKPGALTVEQYASLVAELMIAPQKQAEILARYHLPDDVARKKVDGDWQVRFAREPAERARFTQLVAEYRKWLLTSKQG